VLLQLGDDLLYVYGQVARNARHLEQRRLRPRGILQSQMGMKLAVSMLHAGALRPSWPHLDTTLIANSVV
jgi:hypothetical protein